MILLSLITIAACGSSDQTGEVNGNIWSNNKWAKYSKSQLINKHKIGVGDIKFMRERSSDLRFFEEKAKRKVKSGFDVTAQGLKQEHDDNLKKYIAKIVSIEEALRDLHGVDVSTPQIELN